MTSKELQCKIQQTKRIKTKKEQVEAVKEAIRLMEKFTQRRWEIFIYPGDLCEEAFEYADSKGYIFNEYFSSYIIQCDNR